MKVSVIVSNYASKQILIPCISVLFNQDFEQYEIILPDLGNFTKEEKTILNQFEKEHANFKILRIPGKNRAELFNEAAKMAKSQLFLFIESHCLAPKNWISEYIQLFQDERIYAAVGNRISVPSDSWVSQCGESFHSGVKKRLKDSSYFDFHNSAIRKECFEKINGILENIPCMAEFELGARLHKSGIKIFASPKNPVQHFGDVSLKDYSNWVIGQGKDRTRILIRYGNQFMQKYFPNQKFATFVPVLKMIRLPLLFVTKIMLYLGMLGFNAGYLLHNFRISQFFFNSIAKNSLRFGMISAVNEFKKNKSNRLIHFVKKALFASTNVPRHVDFEVSTMCNLKCKMCRRRKIDFGNQLMPFESFKKVIDKLPKGIEAVSFGGYGEMMTNPKLTDMIRYAKNAGYSTYLTTNGFLLDSDRQILDLLNGGLDKINISVDYIRPPMDDAVGHMFSKNLLANIKHLAELKKEKNSQIQLNINTVVHKGNYDQITDLVHYAENIGFDGMELVKLDTCANEAERILQNEKEKALYKQIEKMKKIIRVTTPLNRLPRWKKLFYFRKDFCQFRNELIHIRVNGMATPCPYGFSKHNFGNIFEKNLSEIWQNKEFRNIRRNDKHPICKMCGVYK